MKVKISLIEIEHEWGEYTGVVRLLINDKHEISLDIFENNYLKDEIVLEINDKNELIEENKTK